MNRWNGCPKFVRLGVLAAVLAAGAWITVSQRQAGAATVDGKRYIVVFPATQAKDGTFALGGSLTANHQAAVSLVESVGGTVVNDLSRQIATMIVDSANPAFAELLRSSPWVEEVGEDFKWKAFPSVEELRASGAVPFSHPGSGGGGPEQTTDLLESEQWSMMQIQAPEAHAVQAGWRAVDVGILDSGIDGAHIDFRDDPTDPSRSNVDCARGRDFVPEGPGIGTPDPCKDNGFHGTHVAGIVAAQANGVGIVGVAPNVTLVPVKVCDAGGFCYSSASVAGITYAGDAKLDVINMSYFVDDDKLLASTEFKCMDDPTQRAFRRANERALQYARSQGVTPVAALGNSDTDLANPPSGNQCEVVPAESSGVIGTMALGRNSQKAGYSSFGVGATDVAAPGGAGRNGDCDNTVLSTVPENLYACIQGTSMASPHAAGVAALIVSQFGTLGSDGDVKLSPASVEAFLQGSAIDIGLVGYDKCFGHGRINALRAVRHDTSSIYDPNAPFCPEYTE
jgi:lantibiotic leader peptide-processing serine protease